MSESRLAITDPEVWKTQAASEKWSGDIAGHVGKADAIWREKFEGK